MQKKGRKEEVHPVPGLVRQERSNKPLTFLSNFLCFSVSLFSAFSSLASSSPSSPPHTSYAR